MSDDVVRYIEQNRNIYTREAIDKQLLGAGYTAVQIAAAWRTIEPPGGEVIPDAPDAAALSRWDAPSNAPIEKRRPVATTFLFWGILAGFIILSYALPLGLFYLAGTVDPAAGNQINTVALVLFVVLQLGALIGGAMSLNRNRPRAMGLLIGVLMVIVVLPFVSVAVLFGICVASLSGA